MALTEDENPTRAQHGSHAAQSLKRLCILKKLIDRIAETEDGVKRSVPMGCKLTVVCLLDRDIHFRLDQVLTSLRKHRV